MNYKQKIGYTILGAFIMLIGMLINNLTAPPVTAQSNGTFGEIQCTGLTVVNKEGRTLIELKDGGLGGAINLYNLSGQEMMMLAVNQAGSKVLLFNKSFDSEIYDDSETPSLGIQLDSGPLSNYLEVGNPVRGGIRLHNTEAFSALEVYHKNGQGGILLHSDEDIHSLSVYDASHGKSRAGLSAKKLIGLGSYSGKPELVISDKDDTEVVRLP